MTALNDKRIRHAGDPRELPDFQRLCKEIARLGHPACPDVDWRTVEQSSVALFASHGADLQSAAAYALARSHLKGLGGLSEGMMLIETLLRDGAEPWPRSVAAQVDILRGLFGQLQAVLRGFEVDPGDLARLGLLGEQLDLLHLRLIARGLGPISTLEGLRQQLAQLASCKARDAQASALLAQNVTRGSPVLAPLPPRPEGASPCFTPVRPRARKCRAVWVAGVLVAALLVLLALS
jgi:type VI secretion system protein VasL